MSSDFNSNSNDAMFATILGRLEQQDKEADAFREETRASLRYISEQVTKTNGRVRELEKWRDTTQGKIVGAVVVISAVVTLLSLCLQSLLVK